MAQYILIPLQWVDGLCSAVQHWWDWSIGIWNCSHTLPMPLQLTADLLENRTKDYWECSCALTTTLPFRPCLYLVLTSVLSDSITSEQPLVQVETYQRWIWKHLEIRLLRPESEEVWATRGHTVLAMQTQCILGTVKDHWRFTRLKSKFLRGFIFNLSWYAQ